MTMMADGMGAMESSTAVYKPVTTAKLSDLKAMVATLELAHPLRAVVMHLPKEMPAVDYAAVVPVLWDLSERP